MDKKTASRIRTAGAAMLPRGTSRIGTESGSAAAMIRLLNR
ncbi:hypothetical protein [Cohnella nanjingensis]|nr:hypothetical protein [Cohnella nanjingensis]